MKAVFDTNVLVAAFLTEGVCAKLLIRARKKQFQLVTCPFVLQEFERVMKKKVKATQAEVGEAMELVEEAVQIRVDPEGEVTDVCRDRDDNNVWPAPRPPRRITWSPVTPTCLSLYLMA